MSLGGKKTQTTSIDPQLKAAALENLAMAKKIGQLGPIAYTGDTVAGMQPGQVAAIQSGNLGANAFGLPEMAVPTGANLNPYAAYEAALSRIPAGQRAFIESMFINPLTGAAPTMTYGNTAQNNQSAKGGQNNMTSGGNYRSPYYNEQETGKYTSSPSRTSGTGYTSVRDMYDGGGQGRSGATFSGGPLSNAANKAGISPAKSSQKSTVTRQSGR